MAALTPELQNCFPTSGPLYAYMQWAAPLSHTPPILHLTSILPVMAFELCRRGFYLPEYGAPRVWFAIVAPSSIGKTKSLGQAQEFSKSWYAEQFDRGQTRPKPWVSLEGSLPGVIHALTTLTDDQGRTCGILTHPEFSRVLRADDALELLNVLYDGRDLERNLRYLQKRADDGHENGAVVHAPQLSAVVTTTPSALAKVVRSDTIEGGLWQRFLWLQTRIAPDDLQARPKLDPQGMRHVREEWSRWYATMEAWRVQNVSPKIAFRFDAVQWLDTHLFEGMRDLLLREDFVASVALRASTHASHIAAIYAASRLSFHGDQIIVELDDVIRAANLVVRALYTAKELGGALLSKTMELSERQLHLVRLLEIAGIEGISRREVYKAFHGNLDKGAIEQLIQTLIDSEHIVEEFIQAVGPGGGRPGRRLWTTAFHKLRGPKSN